MTSWPTRWRGQAIASSLRRVGKTYWGRNLDNRDEKQWHLQFRDGAAVDTGTKRFRGPDSGKAKLSLLYFIVWAKKYWDGDLGKWLVTSADTKRVDDHPVWP